MVISLLFSFVSCILSPFIITSSWKPSHFGRHWNPNMEARAFFLFFVGNKWWVLICLMFDLALTYPIRAIHVFFVFFLSVVLILLLSFPFCVWQHRTTTDRSLGGHLVFYLMRIILISRICCEVIVFWNFTAEITCKKSPFEKYVSYLFFCNHLKTNQKNQICQPCQPQLLDTLQQYTSTMGTGYNLPISLGIKTFIFHG